jgi:DNA adenine methylase
MTKPYMRWAGGKTQISKEILNVLPQEIPVFWDPTFGGGSIFFALADQGRIGRAHLSDLNWRLIAAAKYVRDGVDRLVETLQGYHDTSIEYAQVRQTLNAITRDRARDDPSVEAVVGCLAIYINRTCFNGLWRENKNGEVNSPYGKGVRGPGLPVIDAKYEKVLRAANAAFRATNATLDAMDFDHAIDAADTNDLVLVDPPYLRRKKTSFTAYVGGKEFGEAEHVRLAERLRGAWTRGVRFLLCSADTPRAREIYLSILQTMGTLTIKSLPARRAINSDGGGRGPVQEMLVWNYAP